MIIPQEIIPPNVIKLHRRSQRQQEEADDEGNEDENEDESKYIIYSDLLKFRKFERVQSSYCLKFLCDDTYTWVKAQDITLLSTERCREWLDRSGSGKRQHKNKKLIQAYEMASKGSGEIDVWEFVEYGSAGRPEEDEEEYVDESPAGDDDDAEELQEFGEDEMLDDDDDDDDDDDEMEDRQKRKTRSAVRPTRSSKRQRAAREKVQQERPLRRTRSTRARAEPAPDSDDFDEEMDEESEEVDIPSRSSTRRHTRRTSPADKKQISNGKKAAAEPERYRYEDDEDWQLVGKGPQDLTVHSSNPLVNRLSQKKNLELHNELKLDLQDKLLMTNKLLMEAILNSHATQEEFEVILDELDIALGMKGTHNELITVFLGNNELLANFRALFNLKQPALKEFGLWDKFMGIFSDIYGFAYVPEQKPWTLHIDADADTASETVPDGITDDKP